MWQDVFATVIAVTAVAMLGRRWWLARGAATETTPCAACPSAAHQRRKEEVGRERGGPGGDPF